MRKLQVLLEDNSYKDIYIPRHFTEDNIRSHCDQLFGEDVWHKYNEYINA